MLLSDFQNLKGTCDNFDEYLYVIFIDSIKYTVKYKAISIKLT